MFRRHTCLMSCMLIGLVCFASRAQAQVQCLQYPIYDDGAGHYLYFSDQFNADPACVYDSEVYVWVTPPPPLPSCPQACGCGCTFRDQNPLDTTARHSDKPIPGPLPTPSYNLGKRLDGSNISAVPGIASPSDGITSVNVGTVWVKAYGKSIPIELYQVFINYAAKAAGVVKPPATPSRFIFVGLEIQRGSLTPTPSVLVPTLETGIKHSGTILVTAPTGDQHTYHIVTQSDLQ